MSETTRELTCIGCPLGCSITVTMNGTDVVSVTGNTCPRGDVSYKCSRWSESEF